jgi:DNA-binding transcriptional ArsR family regulator
MKSKAALDCLRALAHEHRLALFRLLVEAGDEGLSVGDLATSCGLPGATLTHHLHHLRRAGLVSDERRGRIIRCRADYGRMNGLLGFLTRNCCGGAMAPDCGPVTVCKPERRSKS